MSHQSNTVRIKVVANALDNLNEKIVFVGGATLSLYIEGVGFEVRPTDDVDVIIEILNYKERTELEEKLRNIGFSHDVESRVVCRYKIQGIIVDIMPTNDPSIGFSNLWYPDGFINAIDYDIEEGCRVKILSPPYFIATKFEAFKGRGENDGRTSQDFEDIICILEYRESIWEEMNSANDVLRNYLRNEFTQLSNNPYYFEWIDSHVERFTSSATDYIIEQIANFIK